MRLREPQITLNEIKAKAASAVLLVYGANTCWWRVLGRNEPIGYEKPYTGPPLSAITRRDGSTPGLPCDPRGGMLFQTSYQKPEEVWGFIRHAEQSPEHYGRHGVDAFVAAYHGNVLTDDGEPTCFASWDEYNALLDAAGNVVR